MSRQGFGIAIGLILLTGSALADDYTTVYGSHTDPTHAQLLGNALGGSFSASGLDFSNGSINAIRNRDIGNVHATDQAWSAGYYRSKLTYDSPEGRSASFGFVNGMSGGSYQSLINTSNVGSSAVLDTDGEFRWAIKLDGGRVLTSRMSNNGGVDAMVSYSLYNNAGKFIGSMLLFDDKISAPEKDYADVAVLLTLAPTPQAASLGLLGLGGLGVLAGRRRRSAI